MLTCDVRMLACVLSEHFIWNLPHFQKFGQGLMLRTQTNASRAPWLSAGRRGSVERVLSCNSKVVGSTPTHATA